MNKTQVMQAIQTSPLYVKDRWNNYRFTSSEVHRIKFLDKVMRIEKQITFDDGRKEWMRIHSDYFGNMQEVTKDGKKFLQMKGAKVNLKLSD